MVLIKMFILFDEIGKRVTIEKKWWTSRIIWYIKEILSYAFARALRYHKFMIGLWGVSNSKRRYREPGAFLQSESLIKEILVAFSDKVARKS